MRSWRNFLSSLSIILSLNTRYLLEYHLVYQRILEMDKYT